MFAKILNFFEHAKKNLQDKTNKRMYAAAKTTRLTGDWNPINQDINEIIKKSSPIVRARVRQLVRDFPVFARAINILVNYTVGTGIQFQSRVKNEEGQLDRKIITKIEDAIKWAAEEIDISGKLHLGEIEQLIKRQDVENGEFLAVKVFSKDKNRYIPYALQVYESDYLSSYGATPEKGNIIDQGIEINPQTGEVVAYHLQTHDRFGGKTQRIPKEFVLHNFKMLRPGQNRGISPFVSAVLIAHDLNDFIDAEIDGAKMAAKYLGFITTGDIAGFQDIRNVTVDNQKKIEELENAIIEYLNPGEKIELAHHNRPNDSFVPFTKFVLRMVAIATDTTYELLTSDYDSISYSNLRGIRNDFITMMKPHIQRHILHFTQPVIRDIIHYAVLSGRLDLKGYFINPRRYWDGIYIGPGMESIDPLREGRAWIDQIKAGLRSPQEIVASRGRDFEEVLNEIAEAKKMMEERGIPFESLLNIKSKLQQNPSSEGAKE